MHLYLHVPFCARRCSYCDFAIAVRRYVPTDGYVRAVLREWEGWRSHESWVGFGVVDTIYFGGGTPSRLDPRGISTILKRIAGDRRISSSAEVTLEANPDDVTPERAEAWVSAGVNRISLGAQSFDPAVLTWMPALVLRMLMRSSPLVPLMFSTLPSALAVVLSDNGCTTANIVRRSSD